VTAPRDAGGASAAQLTGFNIYQRIMWAIADVQSDDPARQLEGRTFFREVARLAASGWVEPVVVESRRNTGLQTRREDAEAESTRRKRQWFIFEQAVRNERAFASLSKRQQNAEIDKRLAAWLTKSGTPVTAKTIANQRGFERWLSD